MKILINIFVVFIAIVIVVGIGIEMYNSNNLTRANEKCISEGYECAIQDEFGNIYCLPTNPYTPTPIDNIK